MRYRQRRVRKRGWHHLSSQKELADPNTFAGFPDSSPEKPATDVPAAQRKRPAAPYLLLAGAGLSGCIAPRIASGDSSRPDRTIKSAGTGTSPPADRAADSECH